jgi:hypothetical protein
LINRSRVDDSEERRARDDGGAAEAEVMRNDDASLTRCAFENLNIPSTNQAFFRSRAQVTAARSAAASRLTADLQRST